VIVLPSSAFPQVHLAPGKLLIVSEPLSVVTLLGSCVAITMFARRLGLAAICHAMLPAPPRRDQSSIKGETRFRYLSFAVAAMVDAYRQRGVDLDTVEAKMFGGGAVIGHSASHTAVGCIGESNIEVARRLLVDAHIFVCAENVGGSVGRKIIFNTATGEVLHKQFPASAS